MFTKKINMTRALVLAMAVFATVQAQAKITQPTFTIPLGERKNLIRETNTLKLQKEESIQKENPPSTFYLGMLAGSLQPTMLTVQSYSHVMNYTFSKPLPSVAAQVSHFPFTWHGRWGWSASAGYAYGEYDTGTSKTALHLMPTELNVAYRGEYTSTQKFIPYLMAGPSMWNYFQRGTDEFNTAGTILSGSATAGLSVNLNRLGLISGRNETEILLQYQRHLTGNNAMADLSGNSFELGGVLAL